MLAGVILLASLSGWLAFRALDDWPSGVLAGVVALALLLVYAGGPLRVAVMARWAARRALAELDLLLPLVSRALPLLLLFMTFLFINTEVWQIASALPRASLYGVTLLFCVLAVAFLLTRLPEEVREVQRAAAGEALVRACRGTPLEVRARALADSGTESADLEERGDALSSTQRANLVLVLLVTQALQVLLLALAVFVFFIGLAG